MSIHLVGLY